MNARQNKKKNIQETSHAYFSSFKYLDLLGGPESDYSDLRSKYSLEDRLLELDHVILSHNQDSFSNENNIRLGVFVT